MDLATESFEVVVALCNSKMSESPLTLEAYQFYIAEQILFSDSVNIVSKIRSISHFDESDFLLIYSEYEDILSELSLNIDGLMRLYNVRTIDDLAVAIFEDLDLFSDSYKERSSIVLHKDMPYQIKEYMYNRTGEYRFIVIPDALSFVEF